MKKTADRQHPFCETTLSTNPVFAGKMISLQVDTVRLPDGRTATREIVRHPGAVAVLALYEGRMIAVEQFRKPLERAQLEIPAGKLESGERPDLAALRELEEETGFRARSVRHLFSFSTSPGFADEVLHLYFTDDVVPSEKHPDEDEFLTVELLTPEEAEQAVRDGRIGDAKTMLALYVWKLYRLTGALTL
jgi:ADP-ribose pyrophosphatase